MKTTLYNAKQLWLYNGIIADGYTLDENNCIIATQLVASGTDNNLVSTLLTSRRTEKT